MQIKFCFAKKLLSGKQNEADEKIVNFLDISNVEGKLEENLLEVLNKSSRKSVNVCSCRHVRLYRREPQMNLKKKVIFNENAPASVTIINYIK